MVFIRCRLSAIAIAAANKPILHRNLWITKFHVQGFSTTARRSINPVDPLESLQEIISPDDEDSKEPKENPKEAKKKAAIGRKQSRRNGDKKDESEKSEAKEKKKSKQWDRFIAMVTKSFESGLFTFTSLFILGFSGVMYHKLYKRNVLQKISDSFEEGDPSLQLQKHKISNNEQKYWVERSQQKVLDDFVQGLIQGRYLLVIGEKGVGKTSAIMEAVRRVNGKRCAIVDCSSDVELMRIRIGTALNFEFHEDYIGSLFSMRGPRDTTALLDIERAFNKLEEVAVIKSKQNNTPLILIFNNAHLIKNDEEGNKLVELLQQKAESFSGSSLVTMIFNSDDYWLYERLKKLGTRLETINFKDLQKQEAIKALRSARMKYFGEVLSDQQCDQVYSLIGGRPQHITHVAGHEDLISACHSLIDRERTWFLNQCGLLGEAMDDDVMESGKFSTSAMLLMREFVEMDRKRLQKKIEEQGLNRSNVDIETSEHVLPEVPLWRARQIMTRADYIQQYDNLNIFTIDSHSRVRADSVPMMRAFHEIASQEGFDKLLSETVMRVADIESLGRTRELVAKDLLLGGKYMIEKDKQEKKLSVSMKGGTREIWMKDRADDDDDDEGPIKLEDYENGGHRSWWKKRMRAYEDTYVPAIATDEKPKSEDTSTAEDLNRQSIVDEKKT